MKGLFFCDSSSRILVQAHRGGGIFRPENTLESCEYIWGLSDSLVPELDVSTTADGVMVAFHDSDLHRITNDPVLKDKSIRDITWEQARRIDVGIGMGPSFANQHMPRITDALLVMKGHPERRLYLDYKNASLPALASLVRESGVAPQIAFATPNHDQAQTWRSLLPGAETLVWIGNNDAESLVQAVARLREKQFKDITQLQLHISCLPDGKFVPDAGFICALALELKERHILLQAFPFEGRFAQYCRPEVFQEMLGLGVVSFATDFPEAAWQALEKPRGSDAVCPVENMKTLDLRRGADQDVDTWKIVSGRGSLDCVGSLFRECFGDVPAVIVADENTWSAAGERLQSCLHGLTLSEPFIFPGHPVLYAEMPNVELLCKSLTRHNAVPIALGAGTLNDLTKLSAHRCNRPYLAVATAASMDGYTAFGASITHHGSKQTFDCPAPRAMIADSSIFCAAPIGMAVTGYADLMAKVPAGADWLLADALGIEPIHETAWGLVQSRLHEWLAHPREVRRSNPQALEELMEGLIASGLGMQAARSSRPASGAEHQFSHLWDMEGLRLSGEPLPHGSKVGIGALATTALYEVILKLPLHRLDVDKICATWPEHREIEQQVRSLHSVEAIGVKAITETLAKHPTGTGLADRLVKLRSIWPDLSSRLRRQLVPAETLRQKLDVAGAPTTPEEIGVSRERLKQSYFSSRTIRRRYTILDFAFETGSLDSAVEALFSKGGFWGISAPR
jgi:glycerol-1-phosphate dehydrogenase [NAD(P)+]